MPKFVVVLEIESETDPSEWDWGGSVVIEEEVSLRACVRNGEVSEAHGIVMVNKPEDE